MNRAPMIVKKWNRDFEFKEEILRVIPVWVRLPNLPLHCWGEEALSRIVSAIGVPILADECTTKQLKVSYARVLVEVDVTQDFVKDIKVRDNTGKEFWQKAIPEWRPFYCRKCHKLGHECNEDSEKTKEVDKLKIGKKMWIPTTIAKVMQGVTNMEDLRVKIGQQPKSINCEEDNGQQNSTLTEHVIQQLPRDDQSLLPEFLDSCFEPPNSTEVVIHNSKTVEENEEGWTTVQSKKSARKQPKEQHSNAKPLEVDRQTASIEINRDGSPQTPSQQ